MGHIMDANGATLLLCDSVPLVDLETVERPVAAMYLILQSGAVPGAMLRLGVGENYLGRSEENALQIAEGTISRRHALLRTVDDGRGWLTDLGSTNGTFLNGQPLEPHRAVALNDGDRVRFGSNIVAKFSRPDECEERFQRDMFERTVRDPLTGLYHRAYFLELVGVIAERAAMRGLGLAIVMLDIDHFKQVNDEHGHATGDAVLHAVASVLRQSTRIDDLVARYGGEEFVIALPIDEPEAAIDRAERIRRALSARRIQVRGASLKVTASLGVSFAPPVRAQSATTLLATADRGLYEAKRAGRDQVVYISEPVSAPALPETIIEGDALLW
jgi:two-component system, cell cycle response regulator